MLLAGAMLRAGSGFAATQPAGVRTDILVFLPEFFAEAKPADAFDMIARLPGFTLVESDTDVRGLAGAAGNVLFDGRLATSKQETLTELLRRIPAASVARIELIRGRAPAIDENRYDLVANIVLNHILNRRGTIETALARASDHVIRPGLRLEGSRQLGDTRMQGSISLVSEVDDDSGSGTIIQTGADGSARESAARQEWETNRTISAGWSSARPLSGGELSVNASLQHERTIVDSATITILPSMKRHDSQEREPILSGEIGARYRRAVGGGITTDGLILHRASRIDVIETASDDESDERFTESTQKSESIASVTAHREREGLSLHAGLEVALNSLSSSSALEENALPVPLPGSEVDVAERRIEASFGAVFHPRKNLTLEQSLGLEASTLTSTGPAGQTLSLHYVKPRVAATLALVSSQLRFALERTVAQLDFRDFVTSASLDRGDVTAGAAHLRPPATLSASISSEHRFGGTGALLLTYQHDWIQHVIDRVASTFDGETFDAVGNIGPGSRDTGRIELSAPLSLVGLDGLLFHAAVTFRRSRVLDPVTDERRGISDETPVEGLARLSHDALDGRLTWGLDLKLGERKSTFRFDEVRFEKEAFKVTTYVECRPVSSWRLRLEAANLTSRRQNETREEYAGIRSQALRDAIQSRRIGTTPVVMLTVRRSFGGSSN